MAMTRRTHAIVAAFAAVVAVGSTLWADVRMKIEGTRPNLMLGFTADPAVKVVELQGSTDLTNWSRVMVLTNPFPHSPYWVCGLGFVNTNTYFRLKVLKK